MDPIRDPVYGSYDMTRYVRGLVFGLGLLAIGLTTARALDDKDDKEVKAAQKDVLDLCKEIAGGKNVSSRAAEIKKKYEDLNTVMHAYKPKAKGGIGFGSNPKDGIETKVISLGKRVPAGSLDKEGPELIRMANINIAIAEIAKHYAPAKPKGGKGKKDWETHLADQKKESQDLIKAVKAKDYKAVKAAANNLNNACNNCHSDFRD